MKEGDLEGAMESFAESIRLDPDSNPSKYLFLGQLLEGKDALRLYEMGVGMFEVIRGSLPEGAERAKVSQDIAEGLCSVAELFMSDLCFEEDAEERCERALARARELAPLAPEPWQTSASMRISQCKPEEALEFLRKSHSLWHREEEREEGMGEEEVGLEDVLARPSHEFRFQTAKLYIELGQLEPAISVMETIIEEEDTIPEFWCLLGECLLEVGDDDEAALQALTTAKDLFDKADNEVDPDVMERLLQGINIAKSRVGEGNAMED
jgi:tetratricopeptide (TPR) repeat protein